MNPQILNSVYGYYKVGNQYYINRTEAVYNATARKQSVEWHFHSDVYGTIDWSTRPPGTLDDLYRDRAQQLRDKYDYIILLFSGGMDSWAVLEAFLNNGIHIDEIVTRWPRAERKFVKLSLNREQINMGSEYEFAVHPVLKYVEKHCPNTKITMDDFSECFHTELTEADFAKTNGYQFLANFFKYSRSTESELEQVRHNRSIGLVSGSEKIHIRSKDNNLYAFFTDQSNGGDNNPNRQMEFFYWSVDAPLIPVLQAHCIKDFLIEQQKINPEKLKLMIEDWRTIYQQVCYPRYSIDTFQVKKQFGSRVWQSDAWTYQYSPEYYQSWKWLTDQYFNNIDEQYLTRLNEVPTAPKGSNNMIVGLNLFNSPLYLIESNTNLPDFKR
jgi:hypothetical protein